MFHSSAAMAPDPSDPFMFANIRLLLQKQQQQQIGKPSRSRSPSLSKLLHSSLASGDYGENSRRHYKRKSKKRNSSKLPLHYLKPGALAQLRDAQRSARVSSSTCSYKKKRTENTADEVNDEEDTGAAQRSEAMGPHQSQVPAIASMNHGPSLRIFGPLCPQRKKLLAPKTPMPPLIAATTVDVPITPVNSLPTLPLDSGGESLLESLPLELLVRIVCNLHHDQLKPAFHVSKRLRQVVLIARQCHFDFTTPDRERQEALQITPRADLNSPFYRTNALGAGPSILPTPKAPRPVQKPMQARIPLAEMQQLAGPLFHGSTNCVRRVKPLSLPRSSFRAVASHRVLFYEEELCQAVAQNSL